MAASKKSTTKKVSTPAKSVKKPVAKAHASTARKKTATPKRYYRSLKAAAPAQPFISFKLTRQTLYWSILVIFILLIQILILEAQYNVMQAVDNLNSQTQQSVVTPLQKTK